MDEPQVRARSGVETETRASLRHLRDAQHTPRRTTPSATDTAARPAQHCALVCSGALLKTPLIM